MGTSAASATILITWSHVNKRGRMMRRGLVALMQEAGEVEWRASEAERRNSTVHRCGTWLCLGLQRQRSGLQYNSSCYGTGFKEDISGRQMR